ncbi:Phosphate regulon transcriptional regulatory protein PhoB [Alphaproteobacteria bacterium]
MVSASKALKPTVLIVEDDKSIATVISYNLQKEGYNVIIAVDGEEAVNVAKAERPDIILLDWVLPCKSGIEVCETLRDNPDTSGIPIIMISVKDDDLDKVTGLEHGADDYITKPFAPIVVIARIKAVLRRVRPIFADKKLKFHDLEIDLSSYTVSRSGKEIKLSPIEFQILQILMENSSRVLSREALINRIWGVGVDVDARTVDVHITRLRKALLNASRDNIDVIKTVRLVGYKLSLT